MCAINVLFFFSSRRRHTRWPRDWSSDVCSSDLPDGCLRSRFERVLVGAAYTSAIGLQLAKMSLGAMGPDNLLGISAQPGAAGVVHKIQLLSLSAMLLAG